MKKEFILTVLAGLLTVSAFAQDTEDGRGFSPNPEFEVQQILPIEHPSVDKNWTLIFEDDFSVLDATRWNVMYGPRGAGKGKGESVEFRTHENVFINSGFLVLRTKKENYPCTSTNCRYKNKIHPYTSGSIESKKAYKYGYYEIYAKLPVNKGFAPSLWFWNQHNASSGCWYNEVNVFEVHSCNPNTYGAGVHCDFDCPEPGNGKFSGGTITCNDPNFHWYGLEWNKNEITWYLDRKVVWQEVNNWQGQGVQHLLYLILTVELNDSDCAIPNNTTFPKDMVINQINIYSLKCADSNPNITISDFKNFNDYGVKESITINGFAMSNRDRISLRATDYIELKPGFEAPLGAELYLDVHPCSVTEVQ